MSHFEDFDNMPHYEDVDDTAGFGYNNGYSANFDRTPLVMGRSAKKRRTRNSASARPLKPGARKKEIQRIAKRKRDIRAKNSESIRRYRDELAEIQRAIKEVKDELKNSKPACKAAVDEYNIQQKLKAQQTRKLQMNQDKLNAVRQKEFARVSKVKQALAQLKPNLPPRRR